MPVEAELFRVEWRAPCHQGRRVLMEPLSRYRGDDHQAVHRLPFGLAFTGRLAAEGQVGHPTGTVFRRLALEDDQHAEVFVGRGKRALCAGSTMTAVPLRDLPSRGSAVPSRTT